ncbi:MAG: DUF1003 domain-containing protein [Actinomycetota bacterium]
MSETLAPHTCAACRTIDKADGVEDGRLYPVVARRIGGHELRILRSLKHAEDRAADKITDFAGSMRFVYVHTVWFAVWIALNLGLVGASLKFDRFPFGLLTMIVSLEAIFLATFVMISQNRQAARADIRSEIDFENNLRSEIWSVHIGTALGIDIDHVEEMVAQSIEGYKKEANLL